MQPDPLMTGVLLVLLLIASVTDVARHRIYNWNTYPGILLGLALHAWKAGTAGLLFGLTGLLVCGFVMLLCFVLFNMGGGDVKLVAMMGTFLGWEHGIAVMLWTFVLAALMGVAMVVWQEGVLQLAARAFAHLRLVFRAKSWIPLDEEDRRPLQRWLFLAPAALAAVCVWWYLDGLN